MKKEPKEKETPTIKIEKSKGGREWVKSFGGLSDENISEVEVDKDGNIFITGGFIGYVDFDPSDNSFYMSALQSRNAFVLKLDAEGNFLWAKSFEKPGSVIGKALEIDSDGNVYMVTTFQNVFAPNHETLFDAEIHGGQFLVESWSSFFIFKLNSSGDLIWEQEINADFVSCESISIGKQDDIGITGFFEGAIYFGEGKTPMRSFGDKDGFILKIDTAGNTIFTRGIGDFYADYCTKIAINDFGEMYVSGVLNGMVELGLGRTERDSVTKANKEDVFFVQKRSKTGDLLWHKTIGDASKIQGKALKIDALGNLILFGDFEERLDLNLAKDTIVSLGERDVFLLKMDENGNSLWCNTAGSLDLDEANSMALDSAGNIYTVGGFSGRLNFNTKSKKQRLNSRYTKGQFVQKVDEFGAFRWAINIGTVDGCCYSDTKGMDISLNTKGALFVVGDYSNKVNFGTKKEGFDLESSAHSKDAFILKLLQDIPKGAE